MIDWSQYHNFTKSEFDCKHTGNNKMRPEFLEVLQSIRDVYDKPIIINSGYRDIQHPIERYKQRAGEHTYGLAADISIRGTDAQDLFVIAYEFGIRRFGFHQKGEGRYVHLGMGDKFLDFPPALWTY